MTKKEKNLLLKDLLIRQVMRVQLIKLRNG